MDRKSKKRTAPIIEALEPRMMFSADLFGGAVDNPAADDSLASLLDDTAAVLEKQTAQLHKEKADAAIADPITEEGEAAPPLAEVSPRIELVFVDTDTPDYQQLVDDLLSSSDDSRRFNVILLDNTSDGVEQITGALQGYQSIDAVHLISHGEDGAVDLGNTQLNNQNLAAYQAQLQSWTEHLTADADILFYGCDLAASENGQALIDRIATLTGADIAASDDLTGSADLGGDWALEYSVGQIDAQIAFSEQVQATWQGSLSPMLWLSTDSNVASSGANGLDSWTEGQVLEFSGASLDHGDPTAGDLSMVIDFDNFTLDTVDAGALHFVSQDMTVGGANGTFDLKAGDVLVSFLQDETISGTYSSTGLDMLVEDQDLLVFRPNAFNDYSAGTFSVLLKGAVDDDLKGVTLIEQDTTIGGTDIAAGSFLLIAETSTTTSIDLFVPTGVGATTTGTVTPLIDLSDLGIDANRLRGIEVIEAATTIGGQSLAKGDILATLNVDDNVSGVGSNSLAVDMNDVFVLSLTSTGMGTTAGTATMFFDGSDVGLNNWEAPVPPETDPSTGQPNQESPYALALYNYSQLTVDTTSDEVNGDTSSIEALLLNKGTDGKISLREAITAANATPNGDVSDVIRFNITDALANGAHTIEFGSALPTITDTLVIDGTSEPDFSGTPVIRIDGSAAGNNVDGLSFSATSDNSIVRGMMITGFTRDGILVRAGADHLTFTSNWIGTSGAGSTGVGNGDDGIELIGSHATIGGAGPNEGNVITNASDEGINIAGTGVTAHLIQGNYIGLDPDGVSGSGNADVGIAIISGSGNTIGGTTASARNVISNNFEGIEVNTSNNIFQGNYIGTDASGTLDRGNRSDDGIEIQGSATGNLIGGTETGAGNLIAFNALDGVNVLNGSGNKVLGNQIHSNSGLGIDLGPSGVTGNDSGDGANNLQNYPIITRADLTGTNLTLSGTLDANGVSTGYRVEFFGNTVGTQDSTNGEGRFFLGSTQVTTDVNGDGSFTDVILGGVTLSEGDYVTATATRIDDAGQVGSDDQLAYGDTSEFAANVVIANGNSAPELTGANDLNPINEDDLNNSGTLVSDLIAGQVSDADSGSSAGIAVVGVDNTNGTWEYTTNGGGVWTAFGSPSSSAARLLAADVNTLVRFVPDADWNGTVINGITFYAWDQTSGANGGSIAIEESLWVVRDEFSSVSYSNSDGTNVWSTDWVEVDGSGSKPNPAEDGRFSVSGNELKIQVANQGDSITREVNLEKATGATLSFSYDNGLGSSAQLFAQVSKDGGATFDTLVIFDASTNQGSDTLTLDISAYVGSNTQVRFYVSDGVTGAGNNQLSIDNVQIQYTGLGGGSTAFSSDSNAASLIVNAVNEAPLVAGSAGETSYTEQQSAVVVDPGITLEDPDGFDGADPSDQYVGVVRITGNYTADDVLGFTNTAKIEGDLVGNQLTLSVISGQTATVVEFEAALQSVTFYNGSDTPSELDRTISFSFDDGVDSSNVTTKVIQLTAVNDNPVVTLPSSPATYAPGEGAVVIDANATVSDVDSVNFAGGDLRIGFFGGTGTSNDVLSIRNQGAGVGQIGVSGSSVTYSGVVIGATSNGTGLGLLTVTLNADATSDAVQALVRNILYENQSSTPDTTDRQIRFELRDGDGGDNPDVIQTVSFNRDAVITGDTSFSGNEGDAVSGTLSATDADGMTDGTYYTVSSQGAYGTADIRETSGAWAYTPADSNWFGTDSFIVTVTDDQGGTTEQEITITLSPVNDAPVAQDDRVGLSFDGVDDYVVVPHSDSLVMTDHLTMEAWINHSGSGTGSQIIVGKEGEYEIGITADTGEIKWAIADTTPTWGWHNTGYFVEPGEWAHIAVTYDGIAGEVKTYVNGLLVDTFSRSGAIGDVYPAFDELRIGGRENSTDQRFSGLIDEVRIWDTTRTETEIQQNLDGLLAGNEVGLVGNWRFDEGAGTTVTDQSTFANHGTLGGLDAPASEPAWRGYQTTQDAVLDTSVAAINGVLANDIDVESDPLTATNLDTTSTLGLVMLNPDGSFTYDPNGMFDYLRAGEFAVDTFSYTANDGMVDSNAATVTITVTGTNDAAVINVTATDTSVTEDDVGNNTAAGTVTITDPDAGEGSLISSTANYGLVAVDGSGNWTYSLDSSHAAVQALAAGDTLSDTITFTSDDGATQTQVITITGANDAAVISGDSAAAVSEDGSLTDSGTLTISDTDDGEAVFIPQSSAASTSGYGTVDLDNAGNWTYSLDNSNFTVQALGEGEDLSDSFTVTSADGSTQVVSVTITGKDDKALISGNTSFSGNEGDTVSGDINATDVEGLNDGSYFTVTIQATHGVAKIDSATGAWKFAPNDPDWFGTDQFTVMVTDDKGGTTEQIISITLANVDDAAVITGDTSFTGNEGDAVSGDLDATDVDGLTDGNYFSVTGAASNGAATIDAETGAWTFTPTDTNWFGSDQFTVTVTDDEGGTTEQIISITLAN
ncbi:VCBS domain-containing protein, partial [Marinobacter sp.]|uniref:VCBS domain-containing protein n=1 Tax=Marinobacter sp. TaxID=50741 RepID=UPI002B266768